MFAYSHLSQGKEETAQYLVRTKVLLDHIHHTTKLADITCSSWDNLYLVHGLKVPHISKRVTKEQDSWRMMEDVFQTINHITKTGEMTKVYSEPNFEPVPQMSKERIHEVSFGRYTKPNSPIKTFSINSQCNTRYSYNFTDGSKHHSGQLHKDQSKQHYNTHWPRKVECYYC